MATRPTICWSDLRTGTVGVWGLGVEGGANLRRLEAMGQTPVLVDDRPPEDGVDGLEVLATGAGGLTALAHCDVVVKSPGISRYRPEVARLSARGIPLVGGLGLWMQEADLARVACVTGTKGKSTVTSVAGHLLRRLGYRCVVGGNLGLPPWDPAADVPEDPDYWVIETSSFQATDLASSPVVVAVTSLHPDHLDWHGDTERYFADKLSACTQPGADLTVADGDSPALRARRGLLGPRVRWVGAEDGTLGGRWTDRLGLLGGHNRRNAHVARAVLEGLGIPEALDDDAMVAAAEGFRPLESRLEPIGTIAGVTFVDDSLSTNALSTLAALDTFAGRRVALLAGGHDRGIDYGPLADGIAARVEATLVATLPDNGPRIADAVEARAGSAVELAGCADLVEAVDRALAWARPDGVVLLSPAAPSFGRFRDYRDRSAAFAAAMRSAAVRPAPGRSG